MELNQYVRVLRAHWLLILAAVVICTGAAAALAWTRTAVYAAETQLFVSTRPSSDQSENYAGALFAQLRMRSYAELLSGERVTAAVIRRLGLPYTVEELQPRIQAAVRPNTVLLDIKVEDASPLRARTIAETLSSEFPRFVASLETPADGRAAPISIKVAEAAELPSAPVSPNKLLYLLLGAHLGLLLGVAGAAILEGLKSRSDIDSSLRREQISPWTTAAHPQATNDRDEPADEAGAGEIGEAAAAGRRATRIQ
jgi:polysaccharide biosynthesis transport protein